MKRDELSRLRQFTDIVEQVDKKPVATDSVSVLKNKKSKDSTPSVYPHILKHANYEQASMKKIRALVRSLADHLSTLNQPMVGVQEQGLNNNRRDRDVATRNEMYS